MKYGLLVRDKIPLLMRKEGRTPVTHIASDEEYWEALKVKLLDEIEEFYKSNEKEDFVDILEILEAVIVLKKYDKRKLEQLRKQKTNEKGNFSNRVVLDDFDKMWKYI